MDSEIDFVQDRWPTGIYFIYFNNSYSSLKILKRAIYSMIYLINVVSSALVRKKKFTVNLSKTLCATSLKSFFFSDFSYHSKTDF